MRRRDILTFVGGAAAISDFNALHSGKHNAEVQFRAFDVLAIDGDDVRALPALNAQC